jgi:hypothetical protein
MTNPRQALRQINFWALPNALLMTPLLGLWIILRGGGNWVRYERRLMIPASPSSIFAILDPSSRHFVMRRMGMKIERTADEDQERHIAHHSEGDFVITVLGRSTRMMMAYSVRRADNQPIGGFYGSASRYDLEPCSAGVVVTLQENFNMRSDLNPFGRAFHELLMRSAIMITLWRLSAEAQDLDGVGEDIPSTRPSHQLAREPVRQRQAKRLKV